MNTKQKIQQALKEAMRQKDEIRKRTLRLALTAIKLAEVEKGAPLDESSLLGIIQKEIKTRREMIEDARRAGREDLIAAAEAEMAVLREFLPPPLEDQELEQLARDTIATVGATSMKEMGKVMAALMPKVQGRADGKRVSAIVRRLLQGK